MEIVTDQKRAARGMHLEMAKQLLQIRDEVHHAPWRVLMVAGPEPNGEAKAIKELMPRCHLLAVDKNMEYVVKTAEVADAILCCDLSPVSEITDRYKRMVPNPKLMELGKFDLMDLDLCGVASSHAAVIIRINARYLLKSKGVLMVTFSYGRDVTPVFSEELRKLRRHESCYDVSTRRSLEIFLDAKIPDRLKGRIAHLCDRSLLHNLRSVISYMGAHMPMCALLFAGPASHIDEILYENIQDGDFEDLVLVQDGDPCLIYDCPIERLRFLRRSRIAHKAVETRKAALAQASLL